ncbi:hypothetical protein MKX03_032652 [Papaver bracteatum]|nr:hypothetical protein MKX03_032652 [Papaver bracteatum]
MSFTCPSSSSSSSSHAHFQLPILSKSHKRWRCAVTVIYSSRVFLSLANKIAPIKETPFSIGVSRSPTYTALDIISTEQDGDGYISGQKTSFSIVGHRNLIDTVKGKNLHQLSQFGGVHGVVSKLQTDVNDGICGGDIDISHRLESFGTNTYKKPALKGFFHYLMEPFRDTIISILLACAALSIGFDMKENGVKEGWYDGGSIFVAVFLVVVVSAVINFRQSRQFSELSMVGNDNQIDVVRYGKRQDISIFDIVVGDVICLKIGDQIPADGLFLSGHSLQVDESSMTGETEPLEINVSRNPFLLSGCKVVDGYGYMIATSVGMDTAWGEMMSSVSNDSSERTPLQVRLDKLTCHTGKVGLTVAFLVLLVLSTRYFTGNTFNKLGQREFNGSKTKFNDVLNAVVRIISDAVRIFIVAIPEGLPLAVTLTLAYSMKRMMADKSVVRNLASCETMGSATTICTGKTGTLTLNAVEACKIAGVRDNFFTARAIATECGILDPDDPNLNNGAVVEGVEFRNYTVEERMETVDRISVMARASPFDKLLMVQCLKQKGHVVAVTGDGTNDAPALKEADVGITMGIQGTGFAKESSDIVISDDNFATVITVTTNIAALVINFIAAASAGEVSVPLTTVQLLRINLIMDILGALAMATDMPTDELMKKPPVGRDQPLITNVMWRNLAAQALYQIFVHLVLQFKGKTIFGVNEDVKNTIIFNTFVLCQVFDEFNARNLEKKNVFEGILENKLFLGIIGITVVLQVVMVEFLKNFANAERLNWGQWGACIGIAMVSWPIGWVVKCIPVPEKPLFGLLNR